MSRKNLGICANLTSKNQLELCKNIFENISSEFDVSIIHDQLTDAAKSINIPMLDSSNLWSYNGTVIAFSLQKVTQLINIPSNIKVIYMIDSEPLDLGILLLDHNLFKAISTNESRTKEYNRVLGDNIKLINTTDTTSLIQELKNG